MTDQTKNHYSDIIETLWLEQMNIAAINLHPAQCVIRQKYGPRYHVMEEALAEAAALWQLSLDGESLNEHGVFLRCERFDCSAGRYRAEAKWAESKSGLWAMSTGYSTPISGSYSPVSIWNRLAYTSRDDARFAALHQLIEKYRTIAAGGGYGAKHQLEVRQMIEQLETEKMPQLDLF